MKYEWDMSHVNESCHMWCYACVCVRICARTHVCVVRAKTRTGRLSSDRYDWTREMMKLDNTQIALTEIVMIYESCHMWTSHVTHMNTWMLLNAGDNEKWTIYKSLWLCLILSFPESVQLYHLTLSNIIMGWLRWVGSIKLQVSFAEYLLFYRALLQKRPIILRSLLIVATPYYFLDSV